MAVSAGSSGVLKICVVVVAAFGATLSIKSPDILALSSFVKALKFCKLIMYAFSDGLSTRYAVLTFKTHL